jgi:hypothetical protein
MIRIKENTMALPFKKSAECASAAKSARARITELEAERRELMTRLVAMETEGVRPRSSAASLSVHAAAIALLAGENERPPAVIANQGVELQQLHERRAIIDRALELLRQQDLVEESKRIRELMERERPEWMAAVRRRALLALQLQRANQHFETFKRRYSAVGTLPTASFRLLGIGAGGDEVVRCAEELVRAGILTKKECDLS